MYNKNSSNLGDRIKFIIQNAIDTRDFNQLNRDIEFTVKDAIEDAKDALGANRPYHSGDGRRSYRREHANRRKHYRSGWNNEQSRDSSYADFQTEKRSSVSANSTSYPSIPIGRVSGVLLTVFGWILFSLSGISIFVLTLIGAAIHNLTVLGTISAWLSPLFLASLIMVNRGAHIRHRLKRFNQYRQLFNDRSYYAISDLTAYTRLKKKAIIKDLRKMITIGMFPEGHIDEQETCIMLNQESFQQYRELQNRIRNQKSEPIENQTASQTVKETATEKSANTATSAETDAALKQAINNGRECIEQLKEINDALPGEEISQKLDRLETVIDKIFENVALHPEQLSEIQKFMAYYLPTTLKLLKTYQEFELQPVQGDNITSAKSEIESTLDTIIKAFETLLDSLFEDTAMDVSTDISVLKTMLAQEGLTEDTFAAKKAFGGLENE